MPRKYVKQANRTDIDENVIRVAIKNCLKNTMKIKPAVREYGMKRTTLQSRINTLLKKKKREDLIKNDNSGHDSESDTPKYNSKYTTKQAFLRGQERTIY